MADFAPWVPLPQGVALLARAGEGEDDGVQLRCACPCGTGVPLAPSRLLGAQLRTRGRSFLGDAEPSAVTWQTAQVVHAAAPPCAARGCIGCALVLRLDAALLLPTARGGGEVECRVAISPLLAPLASLGGAPWPAPLPRAPSAAASAAAALRGLGWALAAAPLHGARAHFGAGGAPHPTLARLLLPCPLPSPAALAAGALPPSARAAVAAELLETRASVLSRLRVEGLAVRQGAGGDEWHVVDVEEERLDGPAGAGGARAMPPAAVGAAREALAARAAAAPLSLAPPPPGGGGDGACIVACSALAALREGAAGALAGGVREAMAALGWSALDHAEALGWGGPCAPAPVREAYRVVLCSTLRAAAGAPLAEALWAVLARWDTAGGELPMLFRRFVTGASAPPPTPGAAPLRVEVPAAARSREEHAQALEELPVAHTCTSTLELPNYYAALRALGGAQPPSAEGATVGAQEESSNPWLAATVEHLERKLRQAVTEGGAGYGLE